MEKRHTTNSRLHAGIKRAIESMEEEGKWNQYSTVIDEMPGVVSLDMNLAKNCPDISRPNVFWLALIMNNPDDVGLATEEEEKFLKSFENKFREKLSTLEHYKFVGHLTLEGVRYFFCYTSEKEAPISFIHQLISEYTDYAFEYEMREDPEWTYYFELLYPDEEELKHIVNKRVVEIISKAEEDPNKEREIEHWLYFKEKEDLDRFVLAIIDMDYKVLDHWKNSSYGEYELGLLISRNDRIGFDNFQEIIVPLETLAQNCNGIYDGWGTGIELE